MLSFEQLTFNIDERIIFANINMTFLPSAIIHLQGANGCGKTSLLRMVAGIQNSTTGNIFYRSVKSSNLQKPYCNYIGHNFGLKSQITVFEYLKFWAEIHDSLETLEPAIYYFKLHNILHKKCYQLSAGNQKKIALAKLIACQSDLWLLDEIESNLDHENKELLHNLIISKANNGGIILLTSHSDIAIKTVQRINLEDYNLQGGLN
jgi:heme exporter protein A